MIDLLSVRPLPLPTPALRSELATTRVTIADLRRTISRHQWYLDHQGMLDCERAQHEQAIRCAWELIGHARNRMAWIRAELRRRRSDRRAYGRAA